MKKVYTFIMAAMLTFAAMVPFVFAEQASSVTVPPALSAAIDAEGGVISNYKVYDTGVNPDARLTVVDSTLVAKKNSLIQPLSGDHRVYSHTEYTIGELQLVTDNTGPINSQKFIVSVAKGHMSTVSSEVTVSGTLQVSGSYNSNVVGLVKASLNLPASGSVSKTYNTTDVWSGPPESDSYNTRDYYGAIDYNKYNITVVQKDYYKEYIGTTYVGLGYETTNLSVNSTLKPINIEYSKDRIVQ